MADIVGVVGDVHDAGLDVPVAATIYLPMLDSVGGGVRAMNFAVRTAIDPASVPPAIRDEIRAIDPALPINDMRMMDGIIGESISRVTFTTYLLVLGAFVALFLGSVGIYGVISYIVSQRTSELGIRQALGATPADVRALVMRQGMVLAGIGVLVGLTAAAVMGRFLTSLLYGVTSFDPISFVGGAGIFLVVAALASLVPALRAGHIQPAVALREE
jgi:predicted lysophospholipase L1 biosynthesis ABC-type transport system permease subunit